MTHSTVVLLAKDASFGRRLASATSNVGIESHFEPTFPPWDSLIDAVRPLPVLCVGFRLRDFFVDPPLWYLDRADSLQLAEISHSIGPENLASGLVDGRLSLLFGSVHGATQTASRLRVVVTRYRSSERVAQLRQGMSDLNRNELATLESLLQGATNSEIAVEIDRSLRTVESIRSKIMGKFGAATPIQLGYLASLLRDQLAATIHRTVLGSSHEAHPAGGVPRPRLPLNSPESAFPLASQQSPV